MTVVEKKRQAQTQAVRTMNTSNSSMARKGVSIVSQRAISSATVL